MSSKEDLDQLRQAYKAAVDTWVDPIRAEEALATADHSMVAMEAGTTPTSGNMTRTPPPAKLAKRIKTRCVP